MSKKKHKPILVLNASYEGVHDYHSQGLPEDFTWVFIDEDKPEDSLESILQIESEVTDPELKPWLEDIKQGLAERVKETLKEQVRMSKEELRETSMRCVATQRKRKTSE